MTILKFRSRRQRDPFTAAPVAAPAAACSPDRCLNGVACYAPACYGTSSYGRADSQKPHGIATPETLAAIVEQAQAAAAEAAAKALAEQQTATMTRPPWPPAAVPPGPDLLADGAHALYGWDITKMDNPPHHDRPYIPGVLGSEGRLSPRSAGVAEDLGSLLLFRASVERMTRPCCPACQQATGTWQERLYGTYKHHTRAVPEAAPRQFGIATELRQAHEQTAASADRAERTFAERYLARRAA